MNKQSVFDKFARHVSLKKAAFFQDAGIEFVFGKREGPYVWDIEGEKRLIDCHTNGGVFNLGHRHPEVVSALLSAIDDVDIGNHHFVSREKAELAEQLTGLCPYGMSYAIFGVSGGEAIDTAIKIARKATGRKGVVSAKGGYHGHTGISLAAGDPKYRDYFLSSSSDFIQVPFNDPAALENAMNSDTAAVIFETIPATLGMPMPDNDFFSKVRALCDQNNTLLIIDEVQTGLSRTGKFWGIEHYQTVPDMIVTAKGLGGGVYPVTATILKTELEAVFHEDPFIHISTTGGADIGCRVAGKVLEISSEAGFLDHVNELTVVFANGMAALGQKYPRVISDYRQKGLMSGIKTPHTDFGPLLSKACFDAGLLCVYAGNDTSVLQFLPPLIIEKSMAEEILQRLDRAMEITAQFAG
ncbi:MAG: aspartate aminotransferase family protein [Desulfobacterales bacterium]